MNELQTFTNDEFGVVRSVVIDSAPWFVGADATKALSYSRPADAIADHVDDEDKRLVNVGEMPTLGIGNRGAYIINESGLYSLIFSSKLPAAKRFKRWVTNEVLPAIRKTGGYGATREAEALPPREITNDDYLRAASIVATCKNERLPYVLSYLKMAGISAVYADRLKGEEDNRDKYEVMRLLVKAYNEHGISDAAIGRATGFDRAQIRMYRSGVRFPKADRAEYIKAVVAPMMDGED